MISTGVWQLRTKSRVTVNTKSASVSYMFCRDMLDHFRSDVAATLQEFGAPADLLPS